MDRLSAPGSDRLLGWAFAASLGLHALMVLVPLERSGVLTVAPPARPPALEARLVAPPPPPPAVLKDTSRPDLEKAADPIRKAPRRRLADGAPERPEREPPLPEPADQPTRPVPERRLDLRLPAEERAPERLAGRELNEALGRLSDEIFYPPEALRRGLEGEVVILVRLGDGGVILDASVASGSGHVLLDEAAVRAVRRLGRLSPSTANRAILLPVRFRIM